MLASKLAAAEASKSETEKKRAALEMKLEETSKGLSEARDARASDARDFILETRIRRRAPSGAVRSVRDDLEKANAESARLREQLSGLETKLAEATAAAEADRASAAESAAAEVSAVKDKLKKAIEKGKGLQKECGGGDAARGEGG